MSERTLKQLVGALVVVVVIWGIATLLSGRGGAPGATADVASFLDGVSRTTVTAVRMTGPDGETRELTQAGEGWRINGHPPDSASLARFWNDLEGASIGGLVASNPANHARMGITADSASRLELDVGGDPRTLLMGKQGSRYATSYVRLPDADAVYLLDGNVRAHVVRSVDDWRDKRIVAVDSATVQSVDVTRDGVSYRVVRADSTWTFQGGGAVSPGGIRDILSEINDLRASGFLQEGDSLAALDPGARVVALGSEGDTLVEVTVGSGSGDRWVRVAGDPVIYRVTSYRADRLAPTRERMTGS